MLQPLDRAEAELIRASLTQLIYDFGDELKNEDLRSRVIGLIPAFYRLRDFDRSHIGPERNSTRGRDRILAYLMRYPRTPIDGDELMVVAGIADWQRRVTELRVKFGWWIFLGETFTHIGEAARAAGDEAELTSVSAVNVRSRQYVLMREEQDRDAAYRWNVLRAMLLQKRRDVSVTARFAEYFRGNIGRPVTAEELKVLAGGSKRWARVVREMQLEGWPIVTGRRGRRDDLGIGAYLLERDYAGNDTGRRVV